MKATDILKALPLLWLGLCAGCLRGNLAERPGQEHLPVVFLETTTPMLKGPLQTIRVFASGQVQQIVGQETNSYRIPFHRLRLLLQDIAAQDFQHLHGDQIRSELARADGSGFGSLSIVDGVETTIVVSVPRQYTNTVTFSNIAEQAEAFPAVTSLRRLQNVAVSIQHISGW